ncbi:hypothetical protein BGW39_008426 [Mortierella sp. 14UC]|nr:hypothetical protein BGW39_008426 [Mortierella sp. 14UC]
MKIISITAAVLAVVLATVQAAPLPENDAIGVLVKDNHLNVEAPVNAKASNVHVCQDSWEAVVTKNKANVEAPIDVNVKDLTVGKRDGGLADILVTKNKANVETPIDLTLKDISVL